MSDDDFTHATITFIAPTALASLNLALFSIDGVAAISGVQVDPSTVRVATSTPVWDSGLPWQALPGFTPGGSLETGVTS